MVGIATDATGTTAGAAGTGGGSVDDGAAESVDADADGCVEADVANDGAAALDGASVGLPTPTWVVGLTTSTAVRIAATPATAARMVSTALRLGRRDRPGRRDLAAPAGGPAVGGRCGPSGDRRASGNFCSRVS